MFTSEREMQNIFVNFLKKRKTCGMIFEEVGNRNFFFRTDVVEYKNKTEIIAYELKLKDFNKLIEQLIYTISIYDKNYAVIPENMKDKFLKTLEKYPDINKNKIGIILIGKEKYKIFKSPQKESTRNYQDRWNVTLIPDLIIRGYYKKGINSCKSYK